MARTPSELDMRLVAIRLRDAEIRMVEVGLLEQIGEGEDAAFKLTDDGIAAWAALSQMMFHRAAMNMKGEGELAGVLREAAAVALVTVGMWDQNKEEEEGNGQE